MITYFLIAWAAASIGFILGAAWCALGTKNALYGYMAKWHQHYGLKFEATGGHVDATE